MNHTLEVVWIAAIGGFLVVLSLMPLVLRAWAALGRRDAEISLRKVHTGEIPRAGGLVVLFAVGVLVVIGLAGVTDLSATHELFSVTPLTGALLGALIAGLTGAYDDLVGMRARTKLLFQLIATTVALLYGLHWPALELLLGWELHGLATVLTGVFVLATINAVNMMDGLDGLAGGICLIGFATVAFASVAVGPIAGPITIAVGWTAAACVGAIAGFLVFNRHPAKVFMGDTGSYFLGFLLAALLLHVEPVRWRVPEIQVQIPLLVLALPLFDLTLALMRRLLRGQSVFAGDSDHIHHRLLAAGLSHRRAVGVLWFSTVMFAAMGMLNVIGVGGWWTLLGTVIAMLAAAMLLGYHRLLARLPAFSGERRVGWRDRRREVMEILGMIETLRRGPKDRGVERWRRLAPDVAIVLERLGVPAFEVRRGVAVVVAQGDPSDAWAFLGLPLPGSEGAELRLALAVRLPELQQEQLALLERVVTLMAGTELAARQSTASIEMTMAKISPPTEGAAIPPPR